MPDADAYLELNKPKADLLSTSRVGLWLESGWVESSRFKDGWYVNRYLF